jgi:NTE family protein
MRQILSDGTMPPRAHLLLIVDSGSEFRLGGFVFDRSDFSTSVSYIRISPNIHSIRHVRKETQSIGLALSGGGSGAVAFHLGSLRALNDRGVLDNLEIISAVSGGSVIAAMYAYSDGTFSEFEERVVNLLRNGLQWDIVKELIFTSLLPAVLVTNIVARPINALAVFLGMKPPFLRWWSRTNALERVLAKKLFGTRRLDQILRDELEIVINACELRTGTAFRFGRHQSGGWRYGVTNSHEINVAHAVAASAAYPAFLPALDCEFDFQRKGTTYKQRILLTDGGVYENLGISCMEPGRDSDISAHVFSPDYIICCNAGHGMFSGDQIPNSLISRNVQATSAIMRKTQDAAMKRLHQFAASNLIKGFVLSYLGQNDGMLPYPIPDLVKREEVFGYPTDFKMMKDDDIDRLSLRGEQLTRELLNYYLPDL